MDGWQKAYKAYIQKYARDYCNGDVEVAKQHALVQEVKQQYMEPINKRLLEKVEKA